MNNPPPFATQRIVFLALLLGMTFYAVAVAVVLQTNDGKGLAPDGDLPFDTLILVVGGVTLVAALVARIVLGRRAESVEEPARRQARFVSRLMPIALLEGVCLLALTFWMLTGKAIPHLAVAMVLLAAAIAIAPLSDPDAN